MLGVKRLSGMNNKSLYSNRYVADGKILFTRLVQTARLMVGVGDYQQYLSHMQLRHPDATALSEVAYFRYCQEGRYPSKDSAIKRCPC
jgi:uncharacterized short protein YbdD (DUF466 family)